VEKRNRIVAVRYNDTEYEYLDRRSEKVGLKVSTFVRHLSLRERNGTEKSLIEKIKREFFEEKERK